MKLKTLTLDAAAETLRHCGVRVSVVDGKIREITLLGHGDPIIVRRGDTYGDNLAVLVPATVKEHVAVVTLGDVNVVAERVFPEDEEREAKRWAEEQIEEWVERGVNRTLLAASFRPRERIDE